MPYILNKTDGTLLTTLADASLDITTSLTFVGKNYAGYGEIVNENFLKLLENFSNKTAPVRPIQGQLWFNNASKQLTVSRDGKNFKGIANISTQVDQPLPTVSMTGDLWWDSRNGQLRAYDGTSYALIGPLGATTANWVATPEIVNNESLSMLRGNIDKRTIAVLVNSNFTPSIDSLLNANFSNGVRKGITLAGATETGSTKDLGYYFWGTAAEALVATTAAKVTVTNPSLFSGDGKAYLPLVTAVSGDQELVTANTADFYYDIPTHVLHTTASAARYADLAERYAADAFYHVGTVLVIGGREEVTTTTIRANTAVAGIVSVNPAYRMNCDAGTDETHPYIALKGRVPCKIIGPVKKGDLLVTSSEHGYAEVMMPNDNPCAVIGKALEDFEGSFGVIEVKV